MDIWGTLKGNWDAMGNAKWAVPGYAPYRAARAATKPGRDAAKWLGKKSGFVESDEEKDAKAIFEADRAAQLTDAELIRDAPWNDPGIREASLLMAQQQANMYRQMKNRGNTAAEQSRITGDTLSKFNIGGNQKMSLLQMQLREAKKKEITALKKDNYELARASRMEQQQITKLIMDISMMALTQGLSGNSSNTSDAMGQYLNSTQAQAYASGVGASDLNLELSPYGDQPNGLRDDNDNFEISGGLSSRYRQ